VRTQVPAPETEWIIRHDDALRLVSVVEYQAAHAQMAKSGALWAGFRSEKGKLSGRPEGQTTSAHLLGGLLRCGECGSVMVPTPERRRRACAGTTCASAGINKVVGAP
jgi:hypothetical protein